MRVKDFAPHLAGRMLPGLFSPMPFAKKPRFAGDPWATFPHCPQWFWMHSGPCHEPEALFRYAIFSARGVHPALQHPLPAERDSQQVLKAERASADATAREIPAIPSPSVGSMGARQPADAGPQRELFAETGAAQGQGSRLTP